MTPHHAAVAVAVPVRKLFTYAVPPGVESALEPGTRVRVAFTGRRVEGTIVEWPAPPPPDGVSARTIESVLPRSRSLPAPLLELTRFVSDYYLCSWGDAIEAALPRAAGKPRAAQQVRLLRPLRADEDPFARAPARRALVQRLAETGGSLALSALSPRERRLLQPLRREGWIGLERRPSAASEAADGSPAGQGPAPTPAQARVLDQLAQAASRGDYRTFLLFGATGSGKTEVYLRAARETLDRGRGVLYMVPEIGLTPLLLSTIERRFPGLAVVLHSGLSRRERAEAWERVREDRCRFVIGTRSAVFAPVNDVGLIIVDEEQDGSYKQGESPRYNGRDVAVVRGRQSQAIVLLGSATPSMESFRHARAGRYGLLRLGGRIEKRPLPEVRIVDMRQEFRRESRVAPVSRLLRRELAACLERGDQALVLRNRRGWAIALHCPTCGGRVECPHCSIALTWHRARNRLRCHHCDFESEYPECCPHCSSDELNPLGEGTEKIEELLRRALPGARIERMDRDTVRGRGAHEAILRRFERGEIDVLTGTQMIAKGHDFPRVTLVGVLSADQSLGLPDFRAAERTFQLLTQVAGRAGRGHRPGSVVVQAFDATHPVLRLAATQEYEAFYDREIGYRRALRYPPVAALVRIVVRDSDPTQARGWAELLAQAVRSHGGDRLLVAGPGPAPVERLRGRFRFQVLARTAGRRRLVQAIDLALAAVEGSVPRRAVVVDVDPLSVM